MKQGLGGKSKTLRGRRKWQVLGTELRNNRLGLLCDLVPQGKRIAALAD